MESLPESAGPTCVNNCPFARTGPLRTKSRCEVPMRFTRGGTQVMLVYASGQRMEQRSCERSQL